MTPKNLMILGAVTAVAVGAAAYSVGTARTGTGVEVSGAVFPGLIDKVNDVTKVVVDYRDLTMTMVRGDDGWTMNESDGYPVSAKAAEKVVVQLADLNFYELKTRKPELYGRLQLGDPKAKEAQARRIRVFDAGGTLLADLVAGGKRFNLVGARKEGVYIRKPGNDQTWLAAGELDAALKPGEWLDRRILDIKEADVLSATVRHPDGETIEVSKPDPKARNFTLAAIPEGRELEYDTDPDNIAAVIEELDMDDARKAGAIAFEAGKTVEAAFITRDGLRIDIRMVDKDEVQWATLKASALPDAPAPEKDAKSAAERAAAINERVDGWVFALPGFKGSRLKRRMADMLKEEKPAS